MLCHPANLRGKGVSPPETSASTSPGTTPCFIPHAAIARQQLRRGLFGLGRIGFLASLDGSGNLILLLLNQALAFFRHTASTASGPFRSTPCRDRRSRPQSACPDRRSCWQLRHPCWGQFGRLLLRVERAVDDIFAGLAAGLRSCTGRPTRAPRPSPAKNQPKPLMPLSLSAIAVSISNRLNFYKSIPLTSRVPNLFCVKKRTGPTWMQPLRLPRVSIRT